jgi:hypothetical protein
MSKSYGTNAAQDDRCATSVDRNRQQGYADWYRKFKWSWYVTLTFDREVGPGQARALVERYLRDLEVWSRDTLSCLIVMEQKHYSGLGMPAGRIHFHMLVATTAALTVEIFEGYWNRLPYGGKRTANRKQPDGMSCRDGRTLGKESTSHVQPYDPAISATYYLFKTLHDSPDNWELRRPELMSPTRPASWHTSARTRRSIRLQKARAHDARRRGQVEEGWGGLPGRLNELVDHC